MPSNTTNEEAQSKFAASLESVRAQLTLIESCVKAGRLQWALETAQSLSALVSELPPSLQALVNAAAPTTPAKVWTPPSPEQVQRALDKMFGHMPVVDKTGNLRVCTFNGHMLTLEKVQYLKEQLKWFVQRSHVILFQETNRDALKYLSNETGYGLNVSHRNARGQAVGILFHPRLRWLGQPIYHDYLTEIDGHPEWKDTLRPAVERLVRDETSQLEFSLIDMHTKSNLGGPEATAPVRLVQFEKLVACLAERDKTASGPILRLLGGDMNAAINRKETTEIEPLLNFGFKLVANPDDRSTYFFKGVGSGQFDGFFSQGLDGKLSPLWIPEPLTSKGERWFYSEFSDHLPAFIDILI